MSRAKRISSHEYPYHITARCINREWFTLSLESVWDIFSNYLFFCHHAFNLQIHSFVLMNNHFHLLISTPQSNISEVMRYLMTETSREISRQSGRINQTYGGPYFASLIAKDIYYMHVYKYIYRNPVDAKITKTVEEYKFSTLSQLLGIQKGIIPLTEDHLLFNNVANNLTWLNTGYSEENKKAIGSALRKKSFSFPRDRISRKENILETHLS